MNHILKIITAAAFSAALQFTSAAQSGPHLLYDADFSLNFDNREYDISGFQTSETIFGARLEPSAGLEIRNGKLTHRLMGGIDVMKDFGDVKTENSELFRELKFWYGLDMMTNRGESFGMTAGIFSKNMMKEEWSTAFFSDKDRWYDNNIEGVLMSLAGKDYRLEFACDWTGKIGSSPETREKFMLMSAGHGKWGWLTLGYNAYGIHYANSELVKGVVDNILAEPYAKVDIKSLLNASLQGFHIKVGWLESIQRDRRLGNGFDFSGVMEFTAAIRQWNVQLENSFFCGTDLLPYYNETDAGGIMYGDRLYCSDPFFRLDKEGDSGTHIYDRFEASWMPRICNGVYLGISAVLHMNGEGMLGNQEMFKLSVNLQELL